jgi:hypothetical protein
MYAPVVCSVRRMHLHAEVQLQNFLDLPERRDRDSCPDLGELLCSFAVLEDLSWERVSMHAHL